MTYTSVVVGTDGSATAEKAVREAAMLAALDKARLVIVTAYEGGGRLTAEEQHAPDELRWLLTDRSQAEGCAQRGREIAAEEGSRGAVVQAVEGRPAEVVLDTARDFNADLIVVGSKGLTGPSRFVLGSVASSVSHHAPCDVLVVHTTA